MCPLLVKATSVALVHVGGGLSRRGNAEIQRFDYSIVICTTLATVEMHHFFFRPSSIKKPYASPKA